VQNPPSCGANSGDRRVKTATWFFGLVLVAGLVIQSGTLDFGPFFPSTKPLGRLVTSRQAVELRSFYDAMSRVVGNSGRIRTTSEFRNFQKVAVDILQEIDPGLSGLGKLNKPVEERLVDAIGQDGEIPDAELSPELRSRLSSALKRISDEF